MDRVRSSLMARKTTTGSRIVTVDAWAWPFVEARARNIVGTAHVFPWSEATKGVALRESFYRAQVRAELCEQPQHRRRATCCGIRSTRTRFTTVGIRTPFAAASALMANRRRTTPSWQANSATPTKRW